MQWTLKSLDWDERVIRVDGIFLSSLRFADDIVLFSKNTDEAEAILNELNEEGNRIVLRINRTNTQFMKNVYCEGERIELEGSQTMKTSSYLYLGRSMSMENDFQEELARKRGAACSAFGPLKEATNQLEDLESRSHLFAHFQSSVTVQRRGSTLLLRQRR